MVTISSGASGVGKYWWTTMKNDDIAPPISSTEELKTTTHNTENLTPTPTIKSSAATTKEELFTTTNWTHSVHTFAYMYVEIDHEIFSMVILSLPLIQEGKLSVICEKNVHRVLVNHLIGLSLPRKSVIRLTDCPNMTLAVDSGR